MNTQLNHKGTINLDMDSVYPDAGSSDERAGYGPDFVCSIFKQIGFVCHGSVMDVERNCIHFFGTSSWFDDTGPENIFPEYIVTIEETKHTFGKNRAWQVTDVKKTGVVR